MVETKNKTLHTTYVQILPTKLMVFLKCINWVKKFKTSQQNKTFLLYRRFLTKHKTCLYMVTGHGTLTENPLFHGFESDKR